MRRHPQPSRETDSRSGSWNGATRGVSSLVGHSARMSPSCLPLPLRSAVVRMLSPSAVTEQRDRSWSPQAPPYLAAEYTPRKEPVHSVAMRATCENGRSPTRQPCHRGCRQFVRWCLASGLVRRAAAANSNQMQPATLSRTRAGVSAEHWCNSGEVGGLREARTSPPGRSRWSAPIRSAAGRTRPVRGSVTGAASGCRSRVRRVASPKPRTRGSATSAATACHPRALGAQVPPFPTARRSTARARAEVRPASEALSWRGLPRVGKARRRVARSTAR